MEIENTLAKKMATAGNENAMLDAVCKKLLAHKNILSWILKTCVEEYKDCSVKEIEENYIEDVPKVAQTAG